MIDLKIDSGRNLGLDSKQELALVTDTEEIKQAVTIALLAIFGEWWLDPTFGLDAPGKIATKPFRQAEAEREARRVILGVFGVVAIAPNSLVVTPDFDNRKAHIRAKIRTIFSTEIEVETSA